MRSQTDNSYIREEQIKPRPDHLSHHLCNKPLMADRKENTIIPKEIMKIHPEKAKNVELVTDFIRRNRYSLVHSYFKNM